ncbi:phenylalanine--tRNA ligase subunit beta [Rickettsiales endosymbiont of Peranema trichophorum]|uniref:phenylalanine--tRNA ligase subunit beta n=1 Tax=Rickettsiales endosymbiont of Peranema trichophorum TaxID=2486577 RepID=UPI0010234D1C|nr:phenylalanine--tRNA ligase subunit beta [Rickettsiales endosymbiont of Peranema trichophorum]RZI46345.1 phenylalanine--tRNA ligase subunit beta [Rickettsiales endosymbiont of Peranema trichophorum]
MKFTLNWLKRHLKTDVQYQILLDKLSAIGLEVESFQDQGADHEQFLVGHILEAVEHPEASKLKVCKVNDGTKTLQIVCGAHNARPGINVVLAPIGTIIPSNGMKIKASKIRGVESQGMLCSAEELCLNNLLNKTSNSLLLDQVDGILELSSDVEVGRKLATVLALNDVIIDIAVPSNRGDIASVYGIARDISAAIGKLVHYPQQTIVESCRNDIKIHIDRTTQCGEFLCRKISNVIDRGQNEEYVKLLGMIGSVSDLPLVNISNFMMFDYGRPNHIYDANKVKGNISVRKALDGEQFVMIGGNEVQLDASVTVVADEEKVLSVAGVIGGELSKVDAHTKDIIVEVADFSPLEVTTARRFLNMMTEAAYRFERRIDAANSSFFMDIISRAILDQCGGEPSNVVTAKGQRVEYVAEILYDHSRFEALVGYNISKDLAISILERLGFAWKQSEGMLRLQIPSWRLGDITRQEDIVEEILRIHGFENLPSADLSVQYKHLSEYQRSNLYLKETFLDRTRGVLASRRMTEVITWSFADEEGVKGLGYKECIKLKNPLTANLKVMRPTLVHNLLQLAHKNLSRGTDNFSIFEVGHVYLESLEEYQMCCIAGIRVGNILEKNVHTDSRPNDFYDVKGDIYAICNTAGLNTEALSIARADSQYLHPGKSATMCIGNKLIAVLGEIHPMTLKRYDIHQNIAVFELFVDRLPIFTPKLPRAQLQLSDLQSVTRDFAFVVDDKLECANIVKIIKLVNKDLIEKVTLFDVYVGSGIPVGKKSVAISVKLQPRVKTLSEDDIQDVSKLIIDKVVSTFGATLR